jgi:hypothetical protein
MLINEGGYGCIYYPGVCSDKDMVSKIVNTHVADREIHMGKLVKKIPEYHKFFIPIVSSCRVQAKKIKKKCKALYKETEFVALQMPMIQTVNIQFGLQYYIDLIPYISKLIKAKIVHFDIKEDNMLFTPTPYIIDFGISLDMKHINLERYFFKYEPRQYQWPIEVHLLCYMVRTPLHTDSLERVCKEVYKQNPFLNDAKDCITHYSFLLTCSKQDGIRRLMHGWKTWDLFALTCILLEHEDVPELIINLHHDPKKRLTPRSSRLLATRALATSTTSDR